jgi:hypothetical protein
MRRLALAALLALPCIAPASNAWAQDRPPLAPTRDATIDYRIEGGASGGARQMRMQFTAGGKLIRIEMPGQQGYVVMDRNANRILFIMAGAKRYLERPLPPGHQAPFEVSQGRAFVRKGTETIAGVPCTVWEGKGDRHGFGCITEDGLVLRGESEMPNGGHMSLIATAVSTAPLGAAVFAPPAGFTRMEMPAGPPGAPRP